MKNIIFVVLLVVMLFFSTLCASAAEKTILRCAAGGMGGNWFATAVAFAELVANEDPSIEISVIPGGGITNPPRVSSGEIEMSLGVPPFSNAAINGTEPYDVAYPNIRGSLQGFNLNINQCIAREYIEAETLEELLKQKYPIKLVTGKIGSCDEFSCRWVLAFYGVDYETIKKWGGSVRTVGYPDQINLIKDGHANVLFQNIAVPSASIIEMSTARKLKVLKFSDEVVDYMQKEKAYAIGYIPKGSYGIVEKDIKAPADASEILFNKDVPEDVVYRITKILCENAEKIRELHPSNALFNVNDAAFDLGAPMHPGAERYYKEKGIIK